MTTASPKKPNILIIVVDSMRADHVSCYGYDRPTTPNIDRLAAEGCLFENAITAAPFSPASYASIFSNLYPHQHGVNGDTVRVWPDHFSRLAEKMKANGYFTFGISNNDFVSTRCNATQGFDEYVDIWESSWSTRQYQRILRQVQKHLGDAIKRRLEMNSIQCAAKGDSIKTVRMARDLIQSRGERPFFGFLVLMDPHAPYRSKNKQFITKSPGVSSFFRRVNVGSMWVECMANGRSPSQDHLRVAMDCYDSEIHHADRCIGELHFWLQERGLLDDTILVVTADHGEAFGEHGVWGHGFCLNDCLTRVPLVVRCPRYWPAGLRSKPLVQLHDLNDLCLSVSVTGEPRPEEHPNCLTQVVDQHWLGRKAVFSEFPVQTSTLKLMQSLNPDFVPGKWGQVMWAVRSRIWRFIEYGDNQQELYDLVNDPDETTTVHERKPNIVNELRNLLAEHRKGRIAPIEVSGNTQEEEFDEIALDRLRALGYVE